MKPADNFHEALNPCTSGPMTVKSSMSRPRSRSSENNRSGE